MLLLTLGLILFLGIHLARVLAPGFRAGFIARRGENAWKGLYAIVSLAGFALLIYGYGLARQDAAQLYVPPQWGRALIHPAMALALVLVIASQLPGGYIKKALQHPQLWGVILWSATHLLVNGDSASVVLFGSFLVWAIIDIISCFGRGRVVVDAPKVWADGLAVVVGLVLTWAFISFAHEWLMGVGVV